MSFIDRSAPLEAGTVDESVVVEFDEHPIEDTTGIEVIETDDGGAMIDFEPEKQEIDLSSLPHGANLAEFMDEKDLKLLASELIEAYDEDKESRSHWITTFTDGLKELGFEKDERSEPFEGSSGVYHPLLAEAATQFQSQAYKELLPAGGPVSVRTVGSTKIDNPSDPNAPIVDIIERANRVKEFMNYEITEEMEEYDPELDQMLFYLSLSGSAFKKVYFDESLGRPVSKYCTAEDVVISNNATDLNSAERVTHKIIMTANELKRRQVFGFYKNIDVGDPDQVEISEIDDAINSMQGTERNSYDSEDYTILEMHVLVDLPGFENEDGLSLPYIITINKDTDDVLGIRRNWDEGNPQYNKNNYFVHYKFLPGLGFYGFGLIHMIGGLASTATSILRQLIDAGTLSNLPGGFKRKGVRVDESPVSPGEWRDVEYPADNIAAAFMPLPYKEPSAVLFQLLGLVIDSGRRFASIADTTISESGSQQNPVGTTMALIERGSKVMSAIHKRLHFAQKKEFKLLAKIFSESMPNEYPYSVGGIQKAVMKADFGPEVDVIPVSDPNIFSMAQRSTLAQQQLQMAQAAPDIHDLRESYRRMYAALEIKNPEDLLKPEDQPQQLTPAKEHAAVLENKRIKAFEGQDHMTHIQAHIAFAQLPIVQQTPDYYTNIVQDIMQHVSFMAMQQAQQQIMQQAQQNPQMMQQAQQMIPQLATQIEGQMVPQIMQQLSPQKPDPMVQMHEKEMQVKQQESTVKAQIEQTKLEQDVLKNQEAELTKRMNILVQQEKADQDTAQKREAAYINANLHQQDTYQKAITDAQRNNQQGTAL